MRFSIKAGCIIAAILFLFVCQKLMAGDTCFSKDGKIVYLTCTLDEKCVVYAIDTEKKNAVVETSLDVQKRCFRDTAMTTDGLLLVLFPNQLVGYDLSVKKWYDIYQPEPNVGFYKMAYNMKGSELFIVYGDGGLKKHFSKFDMKQKTLTDIVHRNIEYLDAPSFDFEGRIYFSYEYNLWQGAISPPDRWTEDDVFQYLDANLAAPLALKYTSIVHNSGIGLASVAVSRNKAYCMMIEWECGYGKGVLSLSREKIMDENVFRNDIHYKSPYEYFSAVLKTVEQLGEFDGRRGGQPCVSPDGRNVFYQAGGRYWFINDDNPPEEIDIDLSKLKIE